MSSLYGYGILIHWGYGKRRKYALEGNSQHPRYEDAVKQLDSLMARKRKSLDGYMAGFGGEIVEIRTLAEGVE